MEKPIMAITYWLGLLCLLVAVVFRGLSILGTLSRSLGLVVSSAGYNSAYKGALLFLVAAIATAAYAEVRGRKIS